MSQDQPAPPFEVYLEHGEIREFAAAMQSDNPAYQGERAVIPPTFLTTAAQWATGAAAITGEADFLVPG